VELPHARVSSAAALARAAAGVELLTPACSRRPTSRTPAHPPVSSNFRQEPHVGEPNRRGIHFDCVISGRRGAYPEGSLTEISSPLPGTELCQLEVHSGCQEWRCARCCYVCSASLSMNASSTWKNERRTGGDGLNSSPLEKKR